MKRTFLVGVSMFALMSGVSAQTGTSQDFEAYQANWKKSHNVTEMTPALYEQMKTDWVNSQTIQEERQIVTEMTATEKMDIKNADRSQSMGLPADFPLKADTGNPEADEDAYQLAKAQWIENNKELYNQMMTPAKVPTKEQLEERRQVLNNQIK